MISRRATWRIVCLSAGGVFLLDTYTDIGIDVSILYVSIIFIVLRTRNERDLIGAGCLCVALTVASYAISPGFHVFNAIVISNISISILVTVSTVYLGLKILHAESDGRKSRDQIARIWRGISMKEMTVAIAHEVAQPLAAIATNASAAKRWIAQIPPNHTEAEDALDRIVRDANRGAEVVSRLRRLIASSSPVEEPVNIGQLIAISMDFMRADFEDAGVSLEKAVPAAPVFVSGDRVLLQQVVMNIFSNALEAMATTEGSAKALTIEVEPSAGQVTVRISDTGDGVPRDMLDRLFDAFYTTKSTGTGMGVGLAVSRSIAESHGGSIHASQNIPHGLTIHLTLPISHPTSVASP